jgi:hypothetical protein
VNQWFSILFPFSYARAFLLSKINSLREIRREWRTTDHH